jgi:hypothetical protein
VHIWARQKRPKPIFTTISTVQLEKLKTSRGMNRCCGASSSNKHLSAGIKKTSNTSCWGLGGRVSGYSSINGHTNNAARRPKPCQPSGMSPAPKLLVLCCIGSKLLENETPLGHSKVRFVRIAEIDTPTGIILNQCLLSGSYIAGSNLLRKAAKGRKRTLAANITNGSYGREGDIC